MPSAFHLKSIADDETGHGARLSVERVTAAVTTEHHFVALMTALIAAGKGGPKANLVTSANCRRIRLQFCE